MTVIILELDKYSPISPTEEFLSKLRFDSREKLFDLGIEMGQFTKNFGK
jgi:hypothetical protein